MKKVHFKIRDLQGKWNEASVELTEKKESLLDLIERAGLKWAYGCRAGSCGVCRIEIQSGLEALRERGFLEEDTFARCQDKENVRLACQALFQEGGTSDCTLKGVVPPEVFVASEDS